MDIDISKSCSDYLRAHTNSSESNQKLKASHARELVAAFFGYKSHAALKADLINPVNELFRARLLVPDIPLLSKRAQQLSDLPVSMTDAKHVANLVADHLKNDLFFTGDIRVYDSFESLVLEELIPEREPRFYDDLSGVMAETNAYFDELYIDEAILTQDSKMISVEATGVYNGESHPDKPFCGDTLDVRVKIDFHKVAGHRAFYDSDWLVGGVVNDDWVDHDVELLKLS